MTENTLN